MYALDPGISLLSLLTSGFDDQSCTRDVRGEAVKGQVGYVVLHAVHEYGVCRLGVTNGLHAV